jgi:hypothetical protein
MPTFQLANPYIVGSMKTRYTASTPLAAASKAWGEMSQYFNNNLPSFNFTLQEVSGSKGQIGGGSQSNYHHFNVRERRSGSKVSYKITEAAVHKMSADVFRASIHKLAENAKTRAAQIGDGEAVENTTEGTDTEETDTKETRAPEPATDDSSVTPADDDSPTTTPATDDDPAGQRGGAHDSSSSSDDKPRKKHTMDDSSDWLDDSSDELMKKRRHFVPVNTPISYFMYDPLLYVSDVFIPTFVTGLTPYITVTQPKDAFRYAPIVPKYHDYFAFWI